MGSGSVEPSSEIGTDSVSLKLITAPSSEPITLAEAKSHCRIDANTDDALVTALIVAAREQAEAYLGRAILTQTWERVLDDFPRMDRGEIELGLPPVQAITQIGYVDAYGIAQTLSASAYSLDADSDPGWALPDPDDGWPATADTINAVRIRFTSGWSSAAVVPQSIKQWMLVQVGYWYANREAAGERKLDRLPYVDCLLHPWRIWRIV